MLCRQDRVLYFCNWLPQFTPFSIVSEDVNKWIEHLYHYQLTTRLYYIWAATWQNKQNGCASSEDSDQSGHPASLIRVFAIRMKKAWVLSYPLRHSEDSDQIRRMRRLIWVFAGRTLILLVLSCRGSIMYFVVKCTNETKILLIRFARYRYPTISIRLFLIPNITLCNIYTSQKF